MGHIHTSHVHLTRVSTLSAPDRGGGAVKARTNYLDADVRKGARCPNVLYMFLSFSVVSLSVDCTH